MQGLDLTFGRFCMLFTCLTVSVSSSASQSFSQAWVKVERSGKISKPIRALWEKSPLYSELVAADVGKRLGTISAADVQKLIEQYPDSAAIAKLRWAKLFRLGRANWHKDFLSLYRETDNIKLNCFKLEAKIVQKSEEASDKHEALRLWTHGKSRPKECDPLFAMMAKKGWITKEIRLLRINKALSERQLRLAKWLAKSMDRDTKSYIKAWSEARATPISFLMKKAKLFPQWVEVAAARLAQRNPDKILELLKNKKIPQSARTKAIVGAVKIMAIKLDPAAAPLLQMTLPPHPVLDHWRVRYFVHYQRWSDVLQAISRLDPKERNQIEWTYWSSRAHAMTGNADLAEQGFLKIAESRSWYGFLASDYLGLPYDLKPRSRRPEQKVIDRVSAMPSIEIARLLFIEGLTVMARRQWNFAISKLTEEQKKASAVLAGQWNWHSRSAVTAHQSGLTDDYALRHPLAYQKSLLKAAKRENLSVTWLWGLMRSESLFMHDIRSPAGALGLMQVMPFTGRQMAKKINMRWRGSKTLVKPWANIRLGSYYLARQLKRFNHPALATAAYNAGPHRVARWHPKITMPLDSWVASIPFTETRNYVQRVLSAQVIYEWLYNGESKRLADLTPQLIHGRR